MAGVVLEVLVDGTPAHLGALSYLADQPIPVGSAVEVPFGKTIRNGMVLSHSGDPRKASKTVASVWGRRMDPADVAAAYEIAEEHFTSVASLARRFAPSTGKGALPADAGPVICTAPPLADTPAGRYLLRAPSTPPAALAAAAAARLAADSGKQILVLCPTKHLVAATLQALPSGAMALSEPEGWAGFVAGSVTIGVGTRTSAMWSPADLGGIVVAEEEHPGHVEARSPHTNARDIAAARCRLRGVPITLTGVTPTGSGLGAGVKVLPIGTLPHIRLAASDRSMPATAIATASQTLKAGRTVLVIAPDVDTSTRCKRCSERCDREEPCRRCGGTAVYRAGVDIRAAREEFPDGTTIAYAGDLPDRTFDLVILLGADRPLRRPGFEPERHMATGLLTATGRCSSDGSLLACVNDIERAEASIGDGSHVSIAKAIWERCRADSLPPFGHTAKITFRTATPPDGVVFPGSTLGPIRLDSGEWEMLVRYPPEARSEFAAALSAFRQRAPKSRYWSL